MGPKFFLDLNVNCVLFETEDTTTTAHLHFKTGGFQTINGLPAARLQGLLLGTHPSRLPAPPTGPVGWSEPGLIHQEDNPEDPSEVVEENTPPAAPRGLSISLPHPAFSKKKAWFYNTDLEGRGWIRAFVNAKGSCSARLFDIERNVAMPKQYGSGPYHLNFASLLEGARELFVEQQPNLERDCSRQLPESVFKHLRQQIDAIIKENEEQDDEEK